MEYKHSYKFEPRAPGALWVCNTGTQKCEPGYSWGPGVRDHELIHYVISGHGVYEVGGRRYELGAGDLFWMGPGESVFYRASDDAPWEYCWVGFRGTEARLLLEETDLSRSEPCLFGADESVYREMMSVCAVEGSDTVASLLRSGGLYRMFAALARTRRKSVLRRDEDIVHRALTYIADNYAMNIGVEEIAAHVGLSRSHLYRMFMSVLGEPPVEVLTRYRIEQACRLLRRGDLAVKAVALSTGFDNQLYFSRRFSRYMGMSPTEYMKSGSEK